MAGEPTLFDDVSERNVIFLIDTSGSMYCRLAIVKQHLKEYLQKMAFRGIFFCMTFKSSLHKFGYCTLLYYIILCIVYYVKVLYTIYYHIVLKISIFRHMCLKTCMPKL